MSAIMAIMNMAPTAIHNLYTYTPALAIVNVAPAAIHTGLRSLMGDPVTMLPPSADTLRIWLPANHLGGKPWAFK